MERVRNYIIHERVSIFSSPSHQTLDMLTLITIENETRALADEHYPNMH